MADEQFREPQQRRVALVRLSKAVLAKMLFDAEVDIDQVLTADAIDFQGGTVTLVISGGPLPVIPAHDIVPLVNAVVTETTDPVTHAVTRSFSFVPVPPAAPLKV